MNRRSFLASSIPMSIMLNYLPKRELEFYDLFRVINVDIKDIFNYQMKDNLNEFPIVPHYLLQMNPLKYNWHIGIPLFIDQKEVREKSREVIINAGSRERDKIIVYPYLSTEDGIDAVNDRESVFTDVFIGINDIYVNNKVNIHRDKRINNERIFIDRNRDALLHIVYGDKHGLICLHSNAIYTEKLPL